MQILLFHKPRSIVVSRQDERGRKTVYDVLPEWIRTEDWVPVGRLDRDTRGLLLLVKDHSLVDLLGTPGKLEKTYEVWVRGHVRPEHLNQIKRGIPSPVGTLMAQRVEIAGYVGPKTKLNVVLDEGKNRHIRRMFGALTDLKSGTPLKVIDLKRIQFGKIPLDVPSGQWRLLTDQEVDALLSNAR
jgi:23S rRNA pseudouridine2605 synthase